MNGAYAFRVEATLRVLLLTNDDGIRETVRRVLLPGHELVPVPDAAAAREKLASGRFDVVLLDASGTDAGSASAAGRDGGDASAPAIVRAIREGADGRSTQVVVLAPRALGAGPAMALLEAGAADVIEHGESLPSRLPLSIRVARARQALEDGQRALIESERDARRDAELASHTKDRFLAFVSHELRSPISAILGWTYLLRAGDLEAADAERVPEIIERSARAQAQLVDDLLDASRILGGKLKLNPRPVEPRLVVEAGIEAVRPAAGARSIDLAARLDTVGAIQADPERLQQVVSNLLSNAIKFSSIGSRVEIHLERDGESIRIRVTDRGRGIEPSALPLVFEPFQKDTRPPGASGLGLGLSIARSIVELHRGRITAESPGPGKGATFTVELPGVPVEAKSTASEPPPEEPGRLDGIVVLVVEDEVATRGMLATLLGCRGAEVRTAGSTADALASIRMSPPLVLVADIRMPGEDGYELIRALRAGEAGRSANLPAIALTALTGLENRNRLLAAGYQVHVTKPVAPERLVALIASLASLPAPA